MKKKPEKPAKGKSASPDVIIQSEEPQGFLLPQTYKRQVRWKENPLFRCTFFLLLLTLIWGGTLVPRWIFLQEWEKSVADQKKTSLEESDWVQRSLTKIRPIRSKYQEIEQMLQFRRIPLSPILASIQTHIPREVSLTSLQWESNLNRTSKNIDITGRRSGPEEIPGGSTRAATLKMNIYATPQWASEKSPSSWVASLEKDLANIGVVVVERNIGKPQAYVATPEIEKKLGIRGAGTIMTVSLGLSLEGPRTKDSKPVRTLPVRPPTRVNTNPGAPNKNPTP